MRLDEVQDYPFHSLHYESPVRVCHNLVMLTPRDDAHVRVRSHRLNITPHPQQLHQRQDFFATSFMRSQLKKIIDS